MITFSALRKTAPVRMPRERTLTLAHRNAAIVASLAIALLIAFGCSMTVSAVRTSIVSFCVNTYNTFTEIFFGESDIEKAPQTIETVYTLEYVPEEYIKTQFKNSGITVETIWENESGDSIILTQDTLNTKLTIDTEKTDFTSMNINNLQILFKDKYGKKTYFWNTDEYQFCLYIIDDDISKEDGIELIQSVVKYN